MSAEAQTALLLPMLNGSAAPMVLHASKNPIPVDAVELDLANIVECDFLGYAPIPLNDFGETESTYEDVGVALTDVLSFTASPLLVTPQTIYFYYVTRHPIGAPAQLYQVSNLLEPLQVCQPNQEIELQVRVMCEGLS